MDALDYIHTDKKTLHRDISPDNIFIRTGSQYPQGISPCLIDFGAAYSAIRDFTQTAPNVKKSGFSPLEQNWDKTLQGSFTDVYAFAANVYYLITRQAPPPAGNRNPKNDPLLPPSSCNPQATPQVDQVILNAMKLEPRERTHTIAQFRAELCGALGVNTILCGIQGQGALGQRLLKLSLADAS